MKRQKDEKGIDFPIFVICQGFELVHYLANDDDKDTLSTVNIFGESRKMDFVVDDVKNYSLFSHFPAELVEKMKKEGLAHHAH